MRMSVRPSVRLSEVRLTHEWFNMSKYALHHTTISQGLISQSRTSPLKLVLLRCECSPQNTVFGNIWFIVIFSEIALKREREVPPVKSENLTKSARWLGNSYDRVIYTRYTGFRDECSVQQSLGSPRPAMLLGWAASWYSGTFSTTTCICLSTWPTLSAGAGAHLALSSRTSYIDTTSTRTRADSCQPRSYWSVVTRRCPYNAHSLIGHKSAVVLNTSTGYRVFERARKLANDAS